jgi:ribosomal protein L12E/L44/L45/RPP1/RPP2
VHPFINGQPVAKPAALKPATAKPAAKAAAVEENSEEEDDSDEEDSDDGEVVVFTVRFLKFRTSNLGS